MSPTAFAPRINHVAISVDADIMDEEGRASLLDFYSEVFGWTEGDNSTEKGNPLILYTGALGQFLYLLPAKDEFMVTPNMDHFGMEVSSKEEMVEILDRVKAYHGGVGCALHAQGCEQWLDVSAQSVANVVACEDILQGVRELAEILGGEDAGWEASAFFL
jgi:hypothetical protein